MTDEQQTPTKPQAGSLLTMSLTGIGDAWSASRRLLVTILVLAAVQAVIPAGQVWVLAELVRTVGEQGVTNLREAALPLAGLVLLVGAGQPLVQMINLTDSRLRIGQFLDYQTRLVQAAGRLRPAQLSKPETATNLQAASTATDYLGSVPGDSLALVTSAISAIGLCVAVCSMNLVAGLFVMGALIPIAAVCAYVARMQEKYWPRYAEVNRLAHYVTEQLLQERTGTELALLGTGGKVAEIAAAHRKRAVGIFDAMLRAEFVWHLLAGLTTSILIAGALVTMVAGNLSGGLTAAAIAGVLSGLGAVRGTGYAYGGLLAAAPHFKLYRQALDLAPPEEPQTVRSDIDRLEVRDLALTYPGASEPALHEVTLHAERGEVIALVGVNGAGKTTTINAILGSLTPDTGKVLIDGADASAMTEPERLSHFGVLTQEYGRFEFTVRQSISLGTPDRDVSDDHLADALRAGLATDLVAGLPDGVDTQLGSQWKGVGLSGGQWQRLALARVAIRNAGIWILDEPTSAIDAEAEREIFAQLQATRAARITIVVSHRAWTLRGMDRIYVFDQGRIVQTGTYEELLTAPGRFADIFADQV